jgi:S-adenosylhomocysteine hydrolase
MVGVISYGNIGGAVCRALEQQSVNLQVYDTDPLKLTLAYGDGFTITTKQNLLRKSAVIIGCTGRNSITAADAQYIKANAILLSGSSQQIEFLDLIENGHKTGAGNPMFQAYRHKTNVFYIAHRGEPINFHDKITPELFEPQMSMALACIQYGLETKIPNTVHVIPMEKQRQVFALFVEQHA